MKEILAENLQSFFDNTKLDGMLTYKGDIYEVWEVSDEIYEKMCEFDDESFEKICPAGMWGSAEGSNMGIPDQRYSVNNHWIYAWNGYARENWERDCERCKERNELMQCRRNKYEACKHRYKDWEECYHGRKYNSLLNYLCEEIGVSQPRNVCALCVDLARWNHMKMSELFKKYEG